MSNKHSNANIVSSLIWKLLERAGASGIQFVVQIVLARLLLPEYFGAIAIVIAFISFANILVQSGFNMALVQKKDADELDFSSVFYLSVFSTLILYLIIFLSAPFISAFYGGPLLTPIIRVLSLTLFAGALNSIQNAYISRNMMFKKLFFSSLGSVIVSGSVGITAAFLGAGIWTLVLQQVVSQITVSVILWFTVKWRPRLQFSFFRIKGLFSYGWKLLVTNLLNTMYCDLRTLIIGRVYNRSALGYYNRGESLPNTIVGTLDGSIQSVMFPSFAAYQDDKQKLKSMMRRSILTSSFFVFPAMVGLAMIAKPFITVVLTDKWLPAAPFIQIFCFSYAIRPLQEVNLQIINAMGRSDINLKLIFVKRGFELALLLITLPFGMHAIAAGVALSSLFSMAVNISPNKRLLNYSLKEQLKDILPALLISFIMGAAIYLFNFFALSPSIIVALQIICGVAVYLALARLFKLDSFNYTIKIFADLIKTKQKYE